MVRTVIACSMMINIDTIFMLDSVKSHCYNELVIKTNEYTMQD